MKERMTVTMPADLIIKVRELAKEDHRSLSAMIALLVKAGIEEKEKAA